MKRVYFLAGSACGAAGLAGIQYLMKPRREPHLEPQIKEAENTILRHGAPISTQLMIRQEYVVSHCRRTRNPEWAAEIISRNSLKGHEGDRSKSKFIADQSIPLSFRSKLADYHNSGYDRGHMVPASDVRSSQSALDETFYLSNICPQDAVLNRAYWAHLEKFTRSLVSSFDDVLVYTGPLYLPKTVGEKAFVNYEVIGNTAVPTHFFKVILGTKGDHVSIGGFIVPNEPLSDEPLSQFVTPVSIIESASGLEFFPNLADSHDKKNGRKSKSLCNTVVCDLKPFKKAKKIAAIKNGL